jgi:hypothetical protein
MPPTGGPEGTRAGVARRRGPGQLARPTRRASPGSRPASHGREIEDSPRKMPRNEAQDRRLRTKKPRKCGAFSESG